MIVCTSDLRKVMVNAGINRQEDLSELTAKYTPDGKPITQRAISNLMNNKTTRLDTHVIVAICMATGSQPGDWIKLVPEQTNKAAPTT